MGGEIVKVAKGNYIEKAKNITNYSGGDINKIAGKKHIKTFEEMVCGEAESPPESTIKRELPAKAITHFRARNWKGEFGFDWFRNSVSEKKEGKIDYKEWIGNYYKEAFHTNLVTNTNTWSNFFKKNNTKLSSLKSLYTPHEYSIEKDKKGNPIKKDYYVPWLALFAQTDNIEPYEAEMQLYIEFEKENKPDKIEFEIPEGIPITITPKIIKKPSKKEKLTMK